MSPASAPPARRSLKTAGWATTRNPPAARDIKPIENSVDEVKVLTGTLPAEYGHSTGGVVTVVKKGGTNSLHGMAADLGRTRMMTHRQFFNLFKTSDPQPGAPNGVPAWFMQPDASVERPRVSFPRSTTAGTRHSSFSDTRS